MLAVPERNIARLFEICSDFEVEASVIGTFGDDARLRIWQGETQVADLDLDFLHGGRPAARCRHVGNLVRPANTGPTAPRTRKTRSSDCSRIRTSPARRASSDDTITRSGVVRW